MGFTAEHRYHRADWPEGRNREVFGASASAAFHGHDYRCDVTVSGEIDERTGMIVDLAHLDRVLTTEVHARFNDRRINLDVPEFADGNLVPTGENLARFIFDRVSGALGNAVVVESVIVREDDTLSAEYPSRR